MASDDFDLAEIDRLVKELAAPPKPAPKPLGAKSAIWALATEAEAPPPPAAPATLAPGRWTSARVIMPAERTDRTHWFRLPTSLDFRTLLKTGLRAWRATPWGTLSVRTFVGLGVVLSAAMPYWPYAHAWSWGLLLYLACAELVVVAGIWGAKLTWDLRLPAAHTVAVGTVLWGIGLLAAETVPRIAYA